jgi:hypothetical protein
MLPLATCSLRRISLVFGLGLALASSPGCGGDDDDGDTADAAPSRPDAGGCDPAAALPLQWRPIAMSATGAVTVTTAGAVSSALIDGTAGGLDAAADNPYVYLDLEDGKKVAIDDVTAFDDHTWDLAFKRASIRANGGDSGTGGVEVATVAAASLDEVTAPPAASELKSDDWASATCTFVGTPGGEPLSAFGEWYAYDEATHAVTPKTEVFVVKSRSGAFYKVRILTYYGDDSMPMRGAVYKVEWAAL